MEQLTTFISDHLEDDTSKLLLNRKKWPGIDMDLAVSCIESRRKLKGKVQEWHDTPGLIFPFKLSAEQCSSSATAEYKASLAEKIVMSASSAGRDGVGKQEFIGDVFPLSVPSGRGWRIADLTGGLGVDSWYFSQRAEKVLYNEMQTQLCKAAEHNFKILGSDNIEISNHAVSSTASEDGIELTPIGLLDDFRPDIVYMDPARRGEGGKKVFLIEDCTPDVLTLKDEIFSTCRHILIKLSPMADITMVCDRLGRHCREVHVVAAGGECKELLIWMDKEWDGEYSIHAVELPNGYPLSEPAVFSFFPSQERGMTGQAGHDFIQTQVNVMPDLIGHLHLFEPGKALMKSGAFNLISERFCIFKIGKSTHYYICNQESMVPELKKHGKVFNIIRCEALDKRTIKAAGREFPKAEVTARNIPMDTDTLRKKLGVTSGDDAHIFGLKSDSMGNLLIIARKV